MYQQRFTIAALIPDPWAKDIQDLRRQYDKWSRQWLPPHITIAPPFNAELSAGTIADIENIDANIAVNFQGWGKFSHERSNVLWLETGENGTKDIRSLLARTLPDLVATATTPPIDWAAPASHHVTVVNRVPHEELAKLEADLRKIDITGDFTIPHLRVFQWDAVTGRWLFARPVTTVT